MAGVALAACVGAAPAVEVKAATLVPVVGCWEVKVALQNFPLVF